MKKKNILITDVFGTLLDGMPTQQRIFADIFEEHGIARETAMRYFYENSDKTLKERIDGMIDGFSADAIRNMEKWLVFKRENAVYDLFPGVAEVFAELNKKNVSVIAISGAKSSVLKKTFDAHKLKLQLILGSDLVEKGDKSIQFIKLHLGYAPKGISAEELSSRAILLGDEESDLKLAVRHNLLGVGIGNTHPVSSLLESDLVINDIREILPLF